MGKSRQHRKFSTSRRPFEMVKNILLYKEYSTTGITSDV
jgi:hypothetical protein